MSTPEEHAPDKPNPVGEACAALQTDLSAELDALVEQEATLQPTDYARRHMALSATIRQLGAVMLEYQEGTMEERPQPDQPAPAPEPEPAPEPDKPAE